VYVYYEHGKSYPKDLEVQVKEALAKVEQEMALNSAIKKSVAGVGSFGRAEFHAWHEETVLNVA
jgi:hypothetical protein